jgi:NAD(P)-dependent dehydrogenase (short-subunit alcohol dehydrogenase family)
MKISFEGRVAIVTGAGNGLGRSHAKALAARGAKVVVNDLGGARDGAGASLSAAESVAEEIRLAGGEAMADGASVTDEKAVAAMVERAMAKWGRVDILINNAGILRDKSFAKMEIADFRSVLDVHLVGSAICTKAVWEIMRTQTYGRILCTTSPSGLHGNFGQANYAAAKAGLLGLMNTLHIEGAKYGIHINLLSPSARTRMTEDLSIPAAVLDRLTPEAVTAGALFLVSEDAPSRAILSCAAGGYARAVAAETPGVYLPPAEQTPENVAARWAEIADASALNHYETGGAALMNFLGKIR